MNKMFLPKGRRGIPDELIQFGRHLVYSEGTKTEPYYIESIKTEIAYKYKCSPNDIDIILVDKDGKSYNTIGLVKHAINDVRMRLKNGESISNVWIFYDKDEFPNDNYVAAYKKIDALNNSKTVNEFGFKYETKSEISWHSCHSNEAFELWLCLYFSYDDASHNRLGYIDKLNRNEKLKKISFVYEKNKTNLHQTLTIAGGAITNAIRFAKKLNEKNNLDNPSTNVSEFAEFFLPYFKK